VLNHSFYVLIFEGTTVKAGMQERGTKRGMEVMWFHTVKLYRSDAGSHNQW